MFSKLAIVTAILTIALYSLFGYTLAPLIAILLITTFLFSMLHILFSETRHSVKVTRAKVLKKHKSNIFTEDYGTLDSVTFLFPNNKKTKLGLPIDYFYSVNVGDSVDIKHRGVKVYSVKCITVSTTRARVVKKHRFTAMEGLKNEKISFFFPDKNTYEMIVPNQYAGRINVGDIVTLTHRSGWVESLKKEQITKPRTKNSTH